MAISFNQIPWDIRTPGFYFELDNRKANKGLVRGKSRLLLIGQKLATGSAAANMPVQVLGFDQAVELFGRGSMLSGMVKAFKDADKTIETWALPLADDAAGVAATGLLPITGTATRAGTLAVYIGGEQVRVGVAVGDTAAMVITAVTAAIAAIPDLTVTAAAAAGGVALTARHKGELFNSLDIRVNYYQGEATPAGLTIEPAAMSGGTANPSLILPLAALGDIQYHHVVLPYTDTQSLNKIEAAMSDRWSATRQIEGQVWSAASGNHSTLTTLGDGRNSEVVSVIGAYKSPTPSWIWASVYAASAAFNLDNDPARPIQTLWLKGLLPPAEGDRFTRDERNMLLWHGISTFTVGVDGRVAIERGITTYRINAGGLPDPSYLDVETLATLAFLRRTWRAWMSQKFPRHKLANDGTNFGVGQAIVTPEILRGETVAWARACEELGLIENIEDFKQALVIERDPTDQNRVNCILPPDLVNQLRVLAALTEFRV